MLPGLKPENLPRATPEEIPVLKHSFPMPVTSLHQIELTSNCDLRCGYCPNKRMGRDEGFRGKQHIGVAHFARALEHVRYYVERGTQHELNLAGIGESTIHPTFPELVLYARTVVGPRVELTLATNGVALSLEDERAKSVAAALRDANVSTYVSQHKPECAGPAARFLLEQGVRVCGFSTDPALHGMDWAGQVEHRGLKQAEASPCMWLREGRAFCLSDGRVSTCCFDAQGKEPIGHVDDPVGSLKTRPYDLCRTCHQHVRVEGYEQRSGS